MLLRCKLLSYVYLPPDRWRIANTAVLSDGVLRSEVSLSPRLTLSASRAYDYLAPTTLEGSRGESKQGYHHLWHGAEDTPIRMSSSNSGGPVPERNSTVSNSP